MKDTILRREAQWRPPAVASEYKAEPRPGRRQER